MQMNDRLLALRLFRRVARLGSFSRAAREAGLSQPSVSRILAALEAELDATLLRRTTRAVTLTDAGRDYLDRIEPLLLGLDEADQAVRGDGVLAGLLRVAMPYSFGVRELVPRLPGFMARHPALRIDLRISDERRDLIADGAEIAFRLGALPDSVARSRKLGEVPRVLAAAPDYLARTGVPDDPAALADHQWIAGPAGRQLVLRGEGDERLLRIDARLTSDANDGAVAAAVAGLGIVATSLWGCRAELDAGQLVRVLPAWRLDPVALHAVYPGGQPPSPAARALTDHLAAAMA